MILDFGSFVINESSLKKLTKDVHGVLNRSARKLMRQELRDNIVTFKFRKRNGEVRKAHGTLNPDYLPKLKGGSPKPERQMVYYDIDKEGWRSFRSYSFIEIIDIKPVETKHHKTKSVEEEEPETKQIKIEEPEKEEKEIEAGEDKEKKEDKGDKDDE